MSLTWEWEEQSPAYGSYGNPNQFTVGGGITSLAREASQNSNDARLDDEVGELHFTFIPLSGTARSRFEEALDWSTLRPHLDAMGAGNQVMTSSMRDGLRYLDDQDELLVLRIEDRNCRGLTGPELATADEDDFGHFIKLCRLDLFSGKDQTAGGSFGLGKAVYWRFSRLQTVLFNSHLSKPWNGSRRNRLFGVNQGTVHDVAGTRYKGRGYFGEPGDELVVSQFASDDTVEALHVARPTDASGTTALVVGFWDPDNPDHGVDRFAADLEREIEESFWPLITRGRMRFFVDIEGDAVPAVEVRPDRTFTELTYALESYDEGNITEELSEVGDVVVRDVPIQVPKRKSAPTHDAFTHSAKLIVTLSDDVPDSLENKVCLFRGPGMVVETISEEFPGVTYHAALLAGAAVDPGAPDEYLDRADNFLRIAEPPTHDRWIPTKSGNLRTSLAANYVPPYVPNLRAIREVAKAELRDLFGVVVAGDDRPPESIVKYLKLIGGSPPVRIGKPQLDLTAARVVDGRWEVTVTATMKNRPEGWSFRPVATFVGVDAGQRVAWQSISAAGDSCTVGEGRVVVEGRPRARTLRATFTAVTDPETHPIPAERSAIDVVALEPGPGTEAS